MRVRSKCFKNTLISIAVLGAGAISPAQSISVDSTKNFTPTGIQAKAGQVFRIQATGTVDIAVPDGYVTDPSGAITKAPAAGSGAYNFFVNSTAPIGRPPAVGEKKLVVPSQPVAYAPFGALVFGYSSTNQGLPFSNFPNGFTVIGKSAAVSAPKGNEITPFLAINGGTTLGLSGSYNVNVEYDRSPITVQLTVSPGQVLPIPTSFGLPSRITATGTVNLAANGGGYVTDPDGVIITLPAPGSPAANYFLTNAGPAGVAPVAGGKKFVLPTHPLPGAPYGALVAGFSSKSQPASYGDFPDGFVLVGASGTVTAPASGGFLFLGVNDFFITSPTTDNRGAFSVTVAESLTPAISSVISLSGFGGAARIAPGGWIEIYGSRFATATKQWAASDFVNDTAPTTLDGVTVTINGRPAFVNLVSPGQINCLAPDGIGTGDVNVVVSNSNGSSAAFRVPTAARVPALLAPAPFKVGGKQYVVAQHTDQAYAGRENLIAGAPFRPATAGDRLVIYGIGFGETVPPTPAGRIPNGSAQLPNVQVRFGDIPAQVEYAGATGFIGLYQFNVVVPNGVTGDVRLSVTVDGVAVSQELWTTVQ